MVVIIEYFREIPNSLQVLRKAFVQELKQWNFTRPFLFIRQVLLKH